jgi:hypothetical protein
MSEKEVTIANQLSWQLFLVSAISFLVFIVCSCLDTWLTFRSTTSFQNVDIANTMKGTTITLLGISLLLPTIFLIYCFVKITKQDLYDIHTSRKNLFVLAMITYVLLLTSASIGIWLSTTISFTGKNEQSALKYTFIVTVVLGVMLPILYTVFYFREKICQDN